MIGVCLVAGVGLVFALMGDMAAIKLHGEFASLNFPLIPEIMRRREAEGGCDVWVKNDGSSWHIGVHG